MWVHSVNKWDLRVTFRSVITVSSVILTIWQCNALIINVRWIVRYVASIKINVAVISTGGNRQYSNVISNAFACSPTMKRSNIALAFEIPLPPLYGNCLLAACALSSNAEEDQSSLYWNIHLWSVNHRGVWNKDRVHRVLTSVSFLIRISITFLPEATVETTSPDTPIFRTIILTI